MGDMADYAIDCAFDDDEVYEKYRDTSIAEQYENDLIDEEGVLFGNPSTIPAPNRRK
jgi:hypothetical protein